MKILFVPFLYFAILAIFFHRFSAANETNEHISTAAADAEIEKPSKKHVTFADPIATEIKKRVTLAELIEKERDGESTALISQEGQSEADDADQLIKKDERIREKQWPIKGNKMENGAEKKDEKAIAEQVEKTHNNSLSLTQEESADLLKTERKPTMTNGSLAENPNPNNGTIFADVIEEMEAKRALKRNALVKLIEMEQKGGYQTDPAPMPKAEDGIREPSTTDVADRIVEEQKKAADGPKAPIAKQTLAKLLKMEKSSQEDANLINC
ncbi:hypothetical protein niasHT_018926 [Heterodera trifolii]|uniref:Uncharacterized protein n=1 Tax=Heterodera trifolii TaxID=157864 RepID=A0ABD2LDN6_9BILA